MTTFYIKYQNNLWCVFDANNIHIPVFYHKDKEVVESWLDSMYD